MARARNIKPGFFKNEDLAACGLDGRLLFAGLWTLADREGRLENRPQRIRAEVFPYEVVDIAKLLKLLRDKGFLKLYRVGAVDYIEIVNWKLHQNPHQKETESRIPPAPEIPVLVGEKPERAVLIPDSLSSDSLIPSVPSPEAQVVVELPLNDDSVFAIREDVVAEMQKLYQAVDVVQEFRNMRGWLIANRPKRKTRSGIMRFANAWLAKRQDQGGKKESNHGISKQEERTQKSREAITRVLGPLAGRDRGLPQSTSERSDDKGLVGRPAGLLTGGDP